jgi:hypothetical protein
MQAGVAFIRIGVIVNYNTGSAKGGLPPPRNAMKTHMTREQTMRMLTIFAIACLTLASIAA